MYHISSKIIFQMIDIQFFDLTSVTCDKVEVYQQENEQRYDKLHFPGITLPLVWGPYGQYKRSISISTCKEFCSIYLQSPPRLPDVSALRSVGSPPASGGCRAGQPAAPRSCRAGGQLCGSGSGDCRTLQTSSAEHCRLLHTSAEHCFKQHHAESVLLIAASIAQSHS